MGLGLSRQLFRADLHVHTLHSGRAKHLRFLRCRDCYSRPLDVYRTAKQRGMDLVTITDHDSIDGCLELLDRIGERPDIMTGEEVTASFPEFRHEVHIAVYGLNEAQHREIQMLRRNGEELVPYLRQQGLLFVMNHPFYEFSRPERLHEFARRMAELFDIFEVRNGTQAREHNALTLRWLEHRRNGGNASRPVGVVAGSDSHTLRRIARTYTASPARTGEEFLADIRAGRTVVFGRHSNHWSLAGDIYGVVLRYYPAVFGFRNGEFPPLLRLKNVFLSLLAVPFLVTPYVVAVRHSIIEQQRMNQFARSLFSEDASLWPSGISAEASV
jgi:predicted metal-dependent phosphoesterase TrpH